MGGWRKLGVIAGGGELPVLLADHLAAQGSEYWFARISGFADAALQAHPGGDFNLGEMGGRFAGLRAAGCDAIVFIGLVKRPDFSQLRFDERGQQMLPDLIAAARQGDDALLRVLVGAAEHAGFRVIGVQDAFEALLAPPGAITRAGPDERAMKDIRKAALVANALNAWDVGQAIVVCDGLVLAVEAQEGTDSMLARVAHLPVEVRGGPEARRGVLVKRPKPGQERRIDLPTIGVRTIEGAAAAGLAGLAIEAGAALIVRREEVAARADALGMFVYGFSAAEVAGP